MWNQFISIVGTATIELPAIELTLLIAAMSLCLVFRFSRTGLIFGYLLVYRWGWLFFMEQSTEMLVAYMVFGSLAGTLTVIGMLRHPE